MSYICYATYNEEFIDYAKQIFGKIGKSVDVQVWDPSNSDQFSEENTKVILARGGTAIRIRKSTNIPVVEIPVPFDDLIRAILKAGSISKSVCVVGYSNLINGLDLIDPLLNINLKQLFVQNENEMFYEMQRLKEDGIEVIVGGISQTKMAQQLGMHAVRIDLSEKALEYAYNEAESILERIIHNIRKTEELNAIINHSKEGYIAIDRYGRVTLANQAATEIIGFDALNLVEKPLNECIPELSKLYEVLESGRESLRQVIYVNARKIICDMMPLKLRNDDVIGAITTFNDTDTIKKAELRIRQSLLDKGLYATYTFDKIIGESENLKHLIDIAKSYAGNDSTVLISGETGVGKELFAQSIHNASMRCNESFVAINCASIPESILESELFGYEEGAFTGARKNGKVGLFEMAHNGTIFLDEISEMPLYLQGRLLRVLQEKKIMRLGSDQIIPVDIRIIAATNRRINDLADPELFRQDLFYRLNILTLLVPPLRDRKDDIGVLAKQFWKEFNNFKNALLTDDAISVLKEYSWPGNIRQLKGFIEKLSVINTEKIVRGSTIVSMLDQFENSVADQINDKQSKYKKRISKEILLETLNKFSGNKMLTANALGVHRSTLWRLMKKYNL